MVDISDVGERCIVDIIREIKTWVSLNPSLSLTLDLSDNL